MEFLRETERKKEWILLSSRKKKKKNGQLIYIGINCACVAAGFGDLCRVPAQCPCVHPIVYVKEPPCVLWASVSVCACACLASLRFSDHMILYISCSIGCWTASTAHNNVKICSIWIPLPAVNVWLLMQPKLHTFVKYMSFDWYRSGANHDNNGNKTSSKTKVHVKMKSVKAFWGKDSVTIQLCNPEDLQSRGSCLDRLGVISVTLKYLYLTNHLPSFCSLAAATTSNRLRFKVWSQEFSSDSHSRLQKTFAASAATLAMLLNEAVASTLPPEYFSLSDYDKKIVLALW